MRLKLRLCWSILRGWPTAYRLRIHDGTMTFDKDTHARVAECTFTQTRKYIYRCDFGRMLARWLPGILAHWLARHWPERLLPKLG